MWIYLVYYGVSAYFAWLAFKTSDKRKIWLYSMISIALPVILAGLRDYSIGIDVENYRSMARYWYGAVRRDSLYEYLAYYHRTGSGEYLFALLIGLVESTTSNFHLFLMLCHLIVVTGVYIGAFRHRDIVNPALVLVLFYLFFFSHSLNIIRQYMAMALIFAVLKDLENGKYLRYIVTVLVASMIHITALIALGALLIHVVLYGYYCIPLRGKKIVPKMNARVIFTLAGLQILVASFRPVARLLYRIGLFPERYSYYLYPQGLSPALIVMGLLVVELVVVLFCRGLMRNKTSMFAFFAVSSGCYLILQELTGIISFGKRIAGYYSLCNLVTIALIANSVKNRKARMMANTGIVLIALAYWLYIYIYRNASETFPYAFYNFM